MTASLAFVGPRHAVDVDLNATVDPDGHAELCISAPGQSFRLPLRTIIAELQRAGVVRRLGRDGNGTTIVLAIPAAAVDGPSP